MNKSPFITKRVEALYKKRIQELPELAVEIDRLQEDGWEMVHVYSLSWPLTADVATEANLYLVLSTDDLNKEYEVKNEENYNFHTAEIYQHTKMFTIEIDVDLNVYNEIYKREAVKDD